MKSINTINLALLSKKKSFDTSVYAKPLLYFSVVCISLFFICYIITFGVLTYYSLRLKNYTDESNVLVQRIEEKRDVEAILLTQNSKLKRIDEISKTELPYNTILTDVISMMTPGVTLETLKVTPDLKVITDLYASSSADLVQFVDSIEERDVDASRYATFTTSSIKRSKEGGYNLALQFILKKNGSVE